MVWNASQCRGMALLVLLYRPVLRLSDLRRQTIARARTELRVLLIVLLLLLRILTVIQLIWQGAWLHRLPVILNCLAIAVNVVLGDWTTRRCRRSLTRQCRLIEPLCRGIRCENECLGVFFPVMFNISPSLSTIVHHTKVQITKFCC